jgi:hypothetical protein
MWIYERAAVDPRRDRDLTPGPAAIQFSATLGMSRWRYVMNEEFTVGGELDLVLGTRSLVPAMPILLALGSGYARPS